MAWYGRSSRLIFNSIRSYASKVTTTTSAPRNINTNNTDIITNKFFSRTTSSTLPTSSSSLLKSRSRFPVLSQPIFRNQALQHGGLLKHQSYSPFHGGAKRYYYVDRYHIEKYKAKGYRWLKNPRNCCIVILVSTGVVITLFFGSLETVPYSKRTHLVLLPNSLEKSLGEREFKKIKNQYKGRVLASSHPDSIRVQRISKELIGALERGMSKEKVWSDKRNGPNEHKAALSDRDKLHKDDMLLEDEVQKSRKKGQERGVTSQIEHLKGLKWEFIVVDSPMINAFCLPGGKIVVFTGLLKHFRTDAAVATVIGHEVGHAVARHSAEEISRSLWLIILQSILDQFLDVQTVKTMSNVLLRLPFSRRMETEADYIGILLLASAGYDPREAPKVYEKLGKLGGGDSGGLQEYLTTHPSGKKRAQLLVQAKVMKEAFELYNEFKEGRETEGFL